MSTPIISPLPPTSLIICSRNRPQLLAQTVESVLRSDDMPTEIVIIDQSDLPHPTLANLEHNSASQLNYVWSHTVGVSCARNTGIATAQHDILAFIDDDMLSTPSWFGNLISALLRGGIKTVVTGQVVPSESEVEGGFAPSTKEDQAPAIYQGRIGTDVLYTGNMALYRHALTDVGLFDERLGPGTTFPSAEDNDLGFRLLETSYRILYVPEAMLYHRAWRSNQEYTALRWRYGRGQGAYFAKYFSLRDPYMVKRMWVGIFQHIYCALCLVRRQRQQAYGNMIYTLGLLSGAAQWLVTQRRK